MILGLLGYIKSVHLVVRNFILKSHGIFCNSIVQLCRILFTKVCSRSVPCTAVSFLVLRPIKYKQINIGCRRKINWFHIFSRHQMGTLLRCVLVSLRGMPLWLLLFPFSNVEPWTTWSSLLDS